MGMSRCEDNSVHSPAPQHVNVQTLEGNVEVRAAEEDSVSEGPGSILDPLGQFRIEGIDNGGDNQS